MYYQEEDDTSALDLISWPFRILITGPSGAGKSCAAIDLMRNAASEMQRLIVVSPTFKKQKLFRELDPLIKNPKRDVFLLANSSTFRIIAKQIEKQDEHCTQNGLDPIKTLIFIDDNTSNNAIHGGRMGALGNLTVICRHYNASLLCISHQGKAICPGFRNNVTGLIAFPTQIKNEIKFITEEFGNPLLWSDESFRKVIIHAWRGGRSDDKELGKHFIFILTPPREKARYFIDFSSEIIPHSDG